MLTECPFAIVTTLATTPVPFNNVLTVTISEFVNPKPSVAEASTNEMFATSVDAG